MADINVILTIDDGLDVSVQVGTCVDHFTDLIDCPSAITANQYVKGNPGGTALEFGAASLTPPGGSDKQVQFNDGGAFGGMAGVKWTKATNKLQLGEGGVPILEEHYGKIYQLIQACGSQNGTYAINCSTHNDHIVTANGNLVLGLSNIVTGQGGLIVLKINNIGGYVITLDGASFTTKLNGSDTIDTVANKKNLISYWNDGTYTYYTISKEA